jgi:hypothetical protein
VRWEDERYVRIYTRDTGDMILMGWEARALFYEIIRKADRAGILDLGKAGKACLGNFLHMPQEVVDRLLPILLENEMVVETPTALIVRNYIEAQEAVSTPASRQRYSREYRRDMIRRGLAPGQRDCAVYFVQSEDGGPIKIGRAEDVAHRLLQLQTSRPDKLVLLAAAPATFEDERKIQDAFAQHRVKGEWFSPVPGLLDLVKSISSLGSIPRDLSRFVTSLSVPCLAVPSRAVSVSGSSLPLPASDQSKPRARPCGRDLVEAFGQERSKVWPACFPWVTAKNRDGSADSFAASLPDDVEMPEVIATMRAFFAHVKAGHEGWDKPANTTDPSFAFGSWKSKFTALREELHGVSPRVKKSGEVNYRG